MSTQATFSIEGSDAISQRLTNMMNNVQESGLQAYLATTVYKKYQLFQIQRWKSAGDGSSGVTTSEGDTWEALKPKYFKYKLKKFAGLEYGGKQMLVARGDLLKAVVGPGEGQQLLITGTSMTISVDLKYAKYVSARRHFASLGEDSMADIKAGIRDYVMGEGY